MLWATVEGGLDSELAEQVMLGKRRLRGHLLPQSLATHSGFAKAACQSLLRIVRIAVSAEVRGVADEFRSAGARLTPDT